MIDLTEKKFEKLTVIKREGSDKRGNAMWLCRCDCGTEKIIRGYNLTSGHTKSCGCLIKEREIFGFGGRLPLGLANMRVRIGAYKRRAKARGLKYNLTESQFKEITQRDCFYCGAKPNNISKNGYQNGDYIYNGLDRVDSDKGYTIDNVVPCCKICNTAKSTLTTKEFKNWVMKIYNNLLMKGE